MALDGARDARHRVGGERRAALGVEAVDGLHEREGGDLLEVLQRLAAAGEAPGEAARERQVAVDELLAEPRISRPLVLRHQVVWIGGRHGA